MMCFTKRNNNNKRAAIKPMKKSHFDVISKFTSQLTSKKLTMAWKSRITVRTNKLFIMAAFSAEDTRKVHLKKCSK